MVYRMTKQEEQEVWGISYTNTLEWMESASEQEKKNALRQAKIDVEDYAHRRDDPDMDTAMDADDRYWAARGKVDAISLRWDGENNGSIQRVCSSE